MMYNPQLDTFICVVETGSFNKAVADRFLYVLQVSIVLMKCR